MQTVLAAVAAGAAVLGLIFANLFPEAVPRRTRWRVLTAGELRPALVLAAVSAVVLFLLTLPSTKPFSPGLTLGWGILIGAVLGLYALFEASGSVAGQSGGVRTAGLLSAAALGPAAILLIFRGYPNQALMGCAIGAVLVAAICSCLARPLFAAAPEEERDRLACFAGVELFVEESDRVEDAPPIGNRHAAGGHVALVGRVDVRGGMMSEGRGAGGGDRPLKRAGIGDVERLRPAHAVRVAPLEGCHKLVQEAVVVDFAMAVDHDHNLAAGMTHADVARRAGESPRVGQQADVWVAPREVGNQPGRSVGRLAVDHEDLEPLRIVALGNELAERALDALRLVPHGNDHGDRRLDGNWPRERFQIGVGRCRDQRSLIADMARDPRPRGLARSHRGTPTQLSKLLLLSWQEI